MDLDIVGMATKTVRGPSTPTFITQPSQFAAVYGGRSITPGGAVYSEGWRALQAGPFGTVCFRRVIAGDAALATLTLSAIVRVDATSLGVWGNNVKVAVEAATDGNANHFNLRVSENGQRGRLPEPQHLHRQRRQPRDGHRRRPEQPGRGHQARQRPAGERRADLPRRRLRWRPRRRRLHRRDHPELAGTEGVGVVLIPEAPPTPATVNAAIVALVAEVYDRVFLTWSGVHGQSAATEISQKNAQITTPSGRLSWEYNSAKVLDPETSTKMDVAPHVVMASILSQNDIDVHPGAAQTRKQTARLLEVHNNGLGRGDLILLRQAGISTLRYRRKKGFSFKDALMTDGSELVDRRSQDFLQLGGANFLDGFLYEKNTEERRAIMGAGLEVYSEKLKKAGRIVEEYRVSNDITSKLQRGQGMELIQWEVRLLGHILFLVFLTNISTSTIIATGEEVP